MILTSTAPRPIGPVPMLGIVFITLKQSVPSKLAEWMQKLIGLTLLILAGGDVTECGARQ